MGGEGTPNSLPGGGLGSGAGRISATWTGTAEADAVGAGVGPAAGVAAGREAPEATSGAEGADGGRLLGVGVTVPGSTLADTGVGAGGSSLLEHPGNASRLATANATGQSDRFISGYQNTRYTSDRDLKQVQGQE